MAFLVIAATASPASIAAASVDIVHFSYAKVLSDLLPPGRAFTRRAGTVLAKLLRAMGMELSRYQRRQHRFLADCDPETSLAALEWWEILLGLPDCEVPTTIEGRRQAAATKLAAAAGHDQSVTFWAGLFAKLGYDFTLFQFNEWIMTCEDDCDDVLLDDAWLLLLWFIVEHGDNDALLECRVEAERLLGMALNVHYRWDQIALALNTGTLYGVASNSEGATVAVGTSGLVLSSSWLLEAWAQQSSGVADVLYAVAAVDTVLVAVGEGSYCIRSVDNGKTWTQVALASEEKYSVARGPAGDKVVVAVGDVGSIYRSEDAGLTWTALSSGVTSPLYGVSACAGAIVAVGADGTIVRSPGGIMWSTVASPVATILRAVDGRGSTLVAVGDAGVVLVSQNAGLSWTLVGVGVVTDLLSVTGSWAGQWTIGGDGGVIVTSSDLATWAVQATTATANLYGAAESCPLGFACLVGASRTIVVE